MPKKSIQMEGEVEYRDNPSRIVIKGNIPKESGVIPIFTVNPRRYSITSPFSFLFDKIGQIVLLIFCEDSDSKYIKIKAGDEEYEEKVPKK